ncbi:uncharacterized protein LOC142635108 [Castanea sativa]|uniref:uncharacterized protein LOC142635108 n=1 Tax=Castanea sativa TaxID=21020 RepID=UPI003F653C22
MAPKDMTKITFTTEWGIYYYTVILFGLKNARATYQRMATALLHDMMHNEYVASKTIKGSIISNFCAKNPIEGEDGKEDFPNEDILDVELGTSKMYFNRAANQYGNGIGILLITLEGSHIPLAIKFNFEVTNNIAEYEACISEMEALQEMGVKEAEVFGDSTLIIAQAQKLWKVKEEHLKPY